MQRYHKEAALGAKSKPLTDLSVSFRMRQEAGLAVSFYGTGALDVPAYVLWHRVGRPPPVSGKPDQGRGQPFIRRASLFERPAGI